MPEKTNIPEREPDSYTHKSDERLAMDRQGYAGLASAGLDQHEMIQRELSGEFGVLSDKQRAELEGQLQSFDRTIDMDATTLRRIESELASRDRDRQS